MKYPIYTLSIICIISALNADINWWQTSGQLSASTLWGFASVYALIGLGWKDD